MRIFFTLLYSIVNFVRILLLCDPPNVLISQFSTCCTLFLQIVSILLQPLTCTGIAWQRFLSVSICLVVDVPQLKEDLLPVLIVAFLIQMGIQILKQQRRVKALYFCKQAFIDLFQQLCLIPLFEHLQQENTFYTSLQGRTFPPAVFTFPWVQNDCMTFFQYFHCFRLMQICLPCLPIIKPFFVRLDRFQLILLNFLSSPSRRSLG